MSQTPKSARKRTERRRTASEVDRRSGEDRRFFPRPEGRRKGGGRRRGDAPEA